MRQPEIAKKSVKPPILGFKVTDVCTTGKLVSSACYDKQQVCVYLQPFSCEMYWSTVADIACFEGGTQILCTRI